MAVVETERKGQVLIVRMNRPERLNALNTDMRQALAETWTDFRHDKELEVAIFTGAGRGFCAGEYMKETLTTGVPGGKPPSSPSIGAEPLTTFRFSCTRPSSPATATWERLRCTSIPT